MCVLSHICNLSKMIVRESHRTDILRSPFPKFTVDLETTRYHVWKDVLGHSKQRSNEHARHVLRVAMRWCQLRNAAIAERDYRDNRFRLRNIKQSVGG
jgi:hypothetical protein